MKICICGGGNLGHVIAGFVAAQRIHEVCVLTRHSERWSHELIIDGPNDVSYTGTLSGVFSDAKRAVSDAELVLLCLPGYAIRETLSQIKDFLRADTPVGSVISSTGFFFEAMSLLPTTQPLFGFQRVPFISRLTEYGHRARLMGYKESLNMAVEHTRHGDRLQQVMSDLLKTPVHLLDSYYEVALSNSNPLLHPARLYDLWSDWHEGITFTRVPLFYEEWTERAAQLYIDMDRELQRLIDALPVKCNHIQTVLEYYESQDATSLARKLRSIEAFKGIKAPMKEVENGYIPDFQSRYFTEDFPYGLALVKRLAQEHNVSVPTIDRVLEWGMSKMSQSKE